MVLAWAHLLFGFYLNFSFFGIFAIFLANFSTKPKMILNSNYCNFTLD